MENNITNEKKCIIIGAGDFEQMDIGLQDGDLCIAADGGMAYCKAMQIEPDFIIGDFDSVSPKVYEAIREMEKEESQRIKHLPTQKDDTDTLAAIRLGLERGYKEFYLYGALGGSRFDHSLANIQCLQFLKNQGANGYIMEKHQKLLLVQDEAITLPADMQGYVSVFALSEKAEGVMLRNLKYELEDVVVTNDFPIGVSNEFEGRAAEISVKKGTLLVIIIEKKQ